MEVMERSQGPPTESTRGDSTVESLISDKTSLIDRFPYASRLGSNDVPSDDETAEIKAFLREPTEQVQEIEAEISSLEAKLVSLRVKHAALKSQVDKCRSLITIPRRLPADILLEIFSHCLPETCNPMMKPNTAPLSLTAVCRRWRILAHQTPKLWSAIHIPIEEIRNHWLSIEQANDLQEAIHRPLYSILSDWLARSGTRPLTFSLYFKRDDAGEDALKAITTRYLHKFLPSISRWKNVFFEGNIHSLPTLLTIPASHFQSLESLFLDLEDTDLPDPIPMLNAPTLRKVSIQKSRLEPTLLALPWARLTHLDLGANDNSYAPSITQLSMVLSLCTLLIYCGVDIDFGPSVHPMYLPRLQRLSIRQPIHYGDSRISSAFCEKLQAPALQQISLRGFNGPGFLALLSKNGQHVQSLNIDNRHIDVAAFADGLRHCPSLLSLSITRLSGSESTLKINDSFFSIFTGRIWADPRCPLLQELIFDDIICETLTGLVSFLEIKQNGDSRTLSPLVMLAPCSIMENGENLPVPNETIYRALKPFTDAGLRLRLYKSIFEREKQVSHSPYGSSLIQYSDCWRD